MTTGKIIALTRRTFVGKVMSLLFNMLSNNDYCPIFFVNVKFKILLLKEVELPKSKRLLISWLQSPSAVILEPKKNKV